MWNIYSIRGSGWYIILSRCGKFILAKLKTSFLSIEPGRKMTIGIKFGVNIKICKWHKWRERDCVLSITWPLMIKLGCPSLNFGVLDQWQNCQYVDKSLTLGHIISTPRHLVFNATCSVKKQHIPFVSLWFDPIQNRTNNLTNLRRTR